MPAIVAATSRRFKERNIVSDHSVVQSREEDEAAVRAVIQQLPATWAEVTSGRAGVDAIAEIFTEDASFVVGDGTYLRGRPEIAAYYRRMIDGADAFGTSIKDTTVVVEVDSVRFLSDTVAAVVSHGGILFAGETEVPAERRGIQTSVISEVNGRWLAAAYQNTRIHQNIAAGE
jgi:uncharacterized protein (TIGR02246 family)